MFHLFFLLLDLFFFLIGVLLLTMLQGYSSGGFTLPILTLVLALISHSFILCVFKRFSSSLVFLFFLSCFFYFICCSFLLFPLNRIFVSSLHPVLRSSFSFTFYAVLYFNGFFSNFSCSISLTLLLFCLCVPKFYSFLSSILLPVDFLSSTQT